MWFNEARPGSSDVRGSADEKQHNNNHAIETEKSALSYEGVTIVMNHYVFDYKL